MRYDPYVCNDSVVSAYLVAVGFGDVGSVNGETEARKLSRQSSAIRTGITYL